MSDRTKKFILWFHEIGIDDVPLVGGKCASLGEMYQQLSRKGVRIPNGFAITASAYDYFLQTAGIEQELRNLLKDLNPIHVKELKKRGAQVRNTILQKQFPEDLREAIVSAYHEMIKQYGTQVSVAVRSSATAEDLPDASFAGQQETFLNVKGEEELLQACKKCVASLFTDRAISYRQRKGFDHFKVKLSIGVQKMVRSDRGASGVMFTVDTESGFKEVVLINGGWGLGENIVQGAINPDTWYVFKPTLKEGKKPIISKKLGEKQKMMIYSEKEGETTKNLETPEEKRNKFCLSDEEVLELARYACIIEDHYSQKNQKWAPQDIEWAKDGIENKIYIVQARPETATIKKNYNQVETYKLKKTGKEQILCSGQSVGSKIAAGKVCIIEDISDIEKFESGSILVTKNTDPNWEPIMKQATAVVTDTGGATCHAAIISRELGLPCIVGTSDGTQKIKPGMEITVDCQTGGRRGIVWEGKLPFEVYSHDLGEIPKTKTKIMMNIANPDIAFELSFLPVSGIGLARLEFIVLNHIKAHPVALLHPENLEEKEKKLLKELTRGYPSYEEYFVERLANGVGTIAAAFYPRPVIIRFSDFKTNEYANLVGGKHFEPHEQNPMIGWRGASRYYHPHYENGFALECKAMKKVRDEYGLTNLITMIPFVRTVTEAEKVLKTMEKYQLKKGENGLKVYGMCEIPSNALCAEQFLEILDGFSIGSNDLTQLTLGVDRDSEIISELYDERNPAVKELIAQTIRVCNEKKKYCGICGEAPSEFPEFAEFLVREGIESISLNPDVILETIFKVAETEKKLSK